MLTTLTGNNDKWVSQQTDSSTYDWLCLVIVKWLVVRMCQCVIFKWLNTCNLTLLHAGTRVNCLTRTNNRKCLISPARAKVFHHNWSYEQIHQYEHSISVAIFPNRNKKEMRTTSAVVFPLSLLITWNKRNLLIAWFVDLQHATCCLYGESIKNSYWNIGAVSVTTSFVFFLIPHYFSWN